MKKILAVVSSSVLALSVAQANIFYSDNFNSYVNGNLGGIGQDVVGQGTWAQNNVSSATPVQVLNGAVVIGTSGQDLYSPLTPALSLTTYSSFYMGVDLNLTAAQAAGDYFLHWSNPAGTTSIFLGRVFARSSGGGFQLGYATTSGGTVSYGTDVLSFNDTLRLVIAYNVVPGALNDTFALYVNPTDLSIEANNTAYVSGSYNGTGAEQTTVAAVNIRQGTGASAPSVTLDNLQVATSFAGAIPEPSTAVLAAFGALLLVHRLRRRS